jgi:serine/threonine protein kinase
MSELKLLSCRLDQRYDILECIGRASYVELYKARDRSATAHSEIVVIKALNVFSEGTTDHEIEQALIKNFQNEAIALDRTRHPNIISRLGHGTALDLEAKPFHYLVLEYMPGGDLAGFCRNVPMDIDLALRYLGDICSGLAHAHDCGVVHRDIKPENLLLGANKMSIKIAGFSNATVEAEETGITRFSSTPYTAPERYLFATRGAVVGHAVQCTPSTDIYSLGKTTYCLLAGEAPHAFSQRQITELPERIKNQVWAGHIMRVIRRATEPQPGKRYQIVQEFWDELTDVVLPVERSLIKPQANGPDQTSRIIRVFLCHSSSDKPAVRALYNRLKSEGADPWLDEKNLLPGQEWESVIPKAVRNSDIVIVCISRDSISKRGFVQKEIRIALDVADEQPEDSIFIIPLRLEACDVPERLRKWQWINFFEEGAYNKLMESLRIRANEIGVGLIKIDSASKR